MSKPINHNTIAWHIDNRRQKRALKRGWAKASYFAKREHFWRDDTWMLQQWRDAGYNV